MSIESNAIDGLTQAVHDLLGAFCAAQAPEEPPDWWLVIKGNEVVAPVLPDPEVPEEVKELFTHYRDVQHGYVRAVFPPPDADPQAVERVRELYVEFGRVREANSNARVYALFQTCLKWKAAYARLLDQALSGRTEGGPELTAIKEVLRRAQTVIGATVVSAPSTSLREARVKLYDEITAVLR